MATTNPNKLTNDEAKIVNNALDMLETSLNRSAKTAKGATIREAFEAEAKKVGAVRNRINSKELEL